MATHSSILAWRATVHGAAESDTAEQLTLLPEGALVCMFPWLFTTRLGNESDACGNCLLDAVDSLVSSFPEWGGVGAVISWRLFVKPRRPLVAKGPLCNKPAEV